MYSSRDLRPEICKQLLTPMCPPCMGTFRIFLIFRALKTMCAVLLSISKVCLLTFGILTATVSLNLCPRCLDLRMQTVRSNWAFWHLRNLQSKLRLAVARELQKLPNLLLLLSQQHLNRQVKAYLPMNLQRQVLDRCQPRRGGAFAPSAPMTVHL